MTGRRSDASGAPMQGSAYELVHTPPGFPAFRRGRLIKVSKIDFFEWMAKGSETVPVSDKYVCGIIP